MSGPLFGLDSHAVVVTGTSRGIGAAIAGQLLDAGAEVLGVSRSPAPEPLETRPGYVHFEHDLCAQRPELVLEQARARLGRIDALVNNAGVLHTGNCWEQTDEELDEMIALNLTTPFLLSQTFAAHWKQTGHEGCILNVCSIESKVAWPVPGQAGYATTKGGLLGLTRAMALELAPYGIRVVAIGPGVIDTGMSSLDPAILARIPLGSRAGTPDEIGRTAAFLLSDAAAYVTGEILYADGGYTLP